MADTHEGRYTETLVTILADDGKCHDDDRFYSGKIRDGRHSRNICRTCPVIIACSIYSARISPKEGTWAGITYTKNGAERV